MKISKSLSLWIVAVGWLTLACWGCRGVFAPTPLAPAPLSPTATPTVSLTPVCGTTPVTVPILMLSPYEAGVHVIQNVTQWNNYVNGIGGLIAYPTPVITPTPVPPPINFSTQMLVVGAVGQPGCANDYEILTINNVCEGPSQVTVNANIATCATCAMCNMITSYATVTSAYAIPQSSLPVSVVYTYSTF